MRPKFEETFYLLVASWDLRNGVGYIVKSIRVGVWVILEKVPRDGGEVEVE